MASPRRQLAALFLFCVIDTLGFGILIPLVPYMAERFGTPPQFITPVLGSYSLCQLLAAPWWGRLSDRFGRRPVLMSSLFGACLSYVLLAFAHNIWWLLAARMLAGVMAGNIAAAFAYASDVSAPERRAATLGLVGAAIGIGFTLGQPIGGLLAGKDAHTASFTAPAVVAACLSVCAILIVRFVLPESHTAAHRALHPDSPRRGAWQLLRERPALALLAGSTLAVTYSQSILESIFAIWALGRFGFGPRTVGFLLFGIALPALLMQGGLVRVLAPRLGEGRLASLGALCYVAGLVLIACSVSVRMAVAGLLLCGSGLGAYNPSASALASRQSRGHDRGAVMGAYVASASLARVLGPLSSGALYAALGPAAPFLVGACVTLPAAWLVRRAAAAA
ncbi:MAG TPA: MFS transporter [Steroidobacteraceae bacterium]|jgi:DHA1 family tetracycline resistance protein-like MFS transporter|nr:MFS transporter [Steroidobacteraceae bacterium]